MSDTFKVRVTGTMFPAKWYADKVGRIFTVENRSSDYKVANTLASFIEKSDCEIVEDFEEYTVYGKTYRQLKDITVKALILAGARGEDIEYLRNRWKNLPLFEPLPFKHAIDYASSCNEKIQWLVDQGFVEVVGVLKPCPFCGGEAKWQTEKRDWIVCSDCKIEIHVMDSTQEAISLWNKRV